MDTERIEKLEARIAELEALVDKLIRLAESYPMGKVIVRSLGVKKR